MADGLVYQSQPSFTHGIAIKPTGWSKHISIHPSDNQQHTRIEVPYSEHSSHDELVNFLQKVPFKVIVPTVGRVGVGLIVAINEGRDDVEWCVQNISAQTAKLLLHNCEKAE